MPRIGRILPTLSPRALWRERHDRRPLWWRDMARWSTIPVALSIVGSLALWEPLARPGALMLLWIVICVAMGTERRDDDHGTMAPPHPRWPRGGRGRRHQKRAGKTTAPGRGPRPHAPRPHRERSQPRRRRTPVG